MNCTPQGLLHAAAGWRDVPAKNRRAVGLMQIEQWAGPNPFDPAPCAAPTLNGGGDAFDCYVVGDTNLSISSNAGTAFTGLWYLGNSIYGYPYKDNFDSYPVGDAGTLSGGDGFTASWVFATAIYGFGFGDNFDGYPVGAPGTLSQGTGFTGDWIYL